ncbi:MAG: sulfite exporter TauE/SafE family protein [Oscillospiraceae bacterium]|nr:sulfite exporter TauE/SafE family protein [Oscillospiraceae bacterium]MBQ6404130.1 sulfite exporter TauE/SafE family protein [Oscillospiraceae bacterium]
MSTEIFQKRVDGVICPNCTYEISARLKRTAGVSSVKTSYIKSEVTAEYDPAQITEPELEAQLAKMGYPVGKGRSNLLSDALGVLCIAALYFLLTWLTGIVRVPAAERGMSMGIVFLTGLLGGVHCIGMCGGIMLTQHNALAYNGGRLIGYTIMGGVFGAVGSALVFSAGLKSAVFVIAGGLVILIGLQMWGVPLLRRLRPGLPSPCGRTGRPFVIGLLTAIMPCGMLASMWFVAASAASAAKGAAIMLVFGLGTCVCMLLFGLLGDALTRKYNKYILKASTMLIITMGLMLLIKGVQMIA